MRVASRELAICMGTEMDEMVDCTVYTGVSQELGSCIVVCNCSKGWKVIEPPEMTK